MFSVIVCSADPAKQGAIRAQYDSALAGEPFEFVLIENPSSLCQGYNHGFAQSRGDIIVFSRDDIEILSVDFPQAINAALSQFDLVGVAGTSRLAGASWIAAGRPYLHGQIVATWNGRKWRNCYGPPSDKLEALDGVFLAARRTVCDSVQFDAITFDGFHLYDLDFTHRAFLAGFKLGLCDIELLHYSIGEGGGWERYAERFISKHRASLRPNLFRTEGPQWAVIWL